MTQVRGPKIIRLSTGVVLGSGVVWGTAGSEVLRDEQRRAPKVPMRYDEDKGREVEDPNDPAFLRAVSEHNERLMERLFAVASLSLQVVTVPEGVDGPDSPEWAEQLRLTGFAQEENGRSRFIQWLRLRAGNTTDDYLVIMAPLMEELGFPIALMRQQLEGTQPAETASATPAETPPVAVAVAAGAVAPDDGDEWL